MDESYLSHHGVLGQKWGIRRYQNPNGSLTPEGRKRYLNSDGTRTKAGEKAYKKAIKKVDKINAKLRKWDEIQDNFYNDPRWQETEIGRDQVKAFDEDDYIYRSQMNYKKRKAEKLIKSLSSTKLKDIPV